MSAIPSDHRWVPAPFLGNGINICELCGTRDDSGKEYCPGPTNLAKRITAIRLPSFRTLNAGGKKSASERKWAPDTEKIRGKTAREWWKSEFKGTVHVTDSRVAGKFKVGPRIIANWRREWREQGWKQPTKSDIK
jgi:hypothetical protein